MWYWDYTPSGGQHHKKSLTKAQMKKLQQIYKAAGVIYESVKNIEEKEQKAVQSEAEKKLKLFF